MKKEEFNKRVKEMCDFVKGCEVENLTQELHDNGIRDPFTYGMVCERNFERNTREDYERKTTFTSDFSMAEWCVPLEGMKAISQTLNNALTNWRDDVEFFAELLLVINLKSWEHISRKNNNYSRMYALLFYEVKDLYFDWFDKGHKKHEEAMQYYFDYVD